MSSRHCLLRQVGWIGVLLLTPLLGGCHLPSDEPCTEAELTWVEDMAPHDRLVDTLTPTLTWNYPDPSCHPDHYHVEIFDQDMVGGTFIPASADDYTPIFSAETENLYYNVPASAGLLPGTTYSWSVRTRVAGDLGPGREVISWFTTGPLCGPGVSMVAPVLTYPPDGAEMFFPDSVKLHWDNQLSCWPGGDIYLQISTRSNFSVPVWFGDVGYVEYIWIQDDPPTFENCTRYFWRVRSDSGGGEDGPYSETRSFVLRRTDAICPLDLGPIITPILPGGVRLPPSAILDTTANCRSGPGTDYPVTIVLSAGQSLEINGRSQENTWWRVTGSGLPRDCWLSGSVITINGEVDAVPLIQVAPAPTLVPTDTLVPAVNCGQYNANTCGQNPACEWDPKSALCRNK